MAVGVAATAWQTAAVVTGWRTSDATRSDGLPGPADWHGGLALWGWRQRPAELLALVASAAIAVCGAALVQRMSVEALARRSSLVAQLRFAVTMQDLRTVMLLRRQLNQERPRSRPWGVARGACPSAEPRMRRAPHPSDTIDHGTATAASAARRRGAHGVRRFPATKLARMMGLAAVAGLALGAAARGTSAALVGAAIALFLVGLEVFEPLSQEVDHPDLTDLLPVDRGALMLHQLIAPAVALVPCAATTGAAAVAVASPGRDRLGEVIAAAAILSIPLMLCGVCGALVSIVRDASDPLAASRTDAFVPPEMAGVSNALRTLWPFVISLAGPALSLTIRAADDDGRSLAGAAVRSSVGCLLLVAATLWWVRRRDYWRARWRRWVNEGQRLRNESLARR
jgi:hypothetical protein